MNKKGHVILWVMGAVVALLSEVVYGLLVTAVCYALLYRTIAESRLQYIKDSLDYIDSLLG